MPKELKKILTYAVVAIVLIWIGGCVIKGQRPVYAKWKLKRQISGLEPWTASTNYSPDGWKRLFKAAKAFQKAEPALSGEAIADHFGRYADKPELLAVEQGKVFLLLRAIFDLPEQAEAGRKFSFADWTRARTDENPDGTVNLAWPISFASGAPRLVAGREGNAGAYSPRNEYTFLRYQFPMRDLSRVQSLQ